MRGAKSALIDRK